MQREKLSSRLGFILLSAGCAIGVGNVWKFPWMVGQYGGGVFVLLYAFFLLLLGLPVMVMEFSVGRAAQRSPAGMYHVLQKPGQKWHLHGWASFIGNTLLVMFYSSVSGWMLRYFIGFASGQMTGISEADNAALFGNMLADPVVTVGFMAIVVVLGFVVLSFGLQKGVERITKYMMLVLLGLMIVLAVHSLTLPGAREGIAFYLKPDFSKITGEVIVAAMNQAFFTLSLGIGAMAIFGSYIGKERSLPGEALNVLVLDTFVAIVAGLIIFPACFTFGVEPTAGPSLLFESMARVFNNMAGGRLWGTFFFLFMFFAAMTTIVAVFENILACAQDLFGVKRVKGCIILGIVVLVCSVPCALGFNLWSDVVPFATGSSILDLEDFIVSYILLPLGSLCTVFFCTRKCGWTFEKFLAEANAGRGLKLSAKLRLYLTYALPLVIFALFLIGIFNFPFADDFTLWGALRGLFI